MALEALALFGSIIIDQVVKLPDFLSRFLIGLGITLMLASVIAKKLKKRTA